MKLFPSDWPGFLDQLAQWGELSIAARRTFLDGMTPGLSLSPATGDPSISELLDARLVEESGSPGYVAVAEDSAHFHQVMKALEKYPLFESPGLAALCSYLSEHYTPQDRSQLHESLALLPNDLPRIAGFVSSVEWLKGALAPRGRASESADADTARRILQFFLDRRDRIPVRDLEEYFPGIPRDELCAGIRMGIQRAVFYLGLRRSDLEPLVGVWPAAARRLRRLSVVLAPEPVAVTRVFRHPFLVDDMTTLLLAARIVPIPLRRGDDKPYTRFVEEAGAMLLSLPDWLESFTGLSVEGRIGLALQAARLTGLLVPGPAGRAGVAPLAPSEQSAGWVGKPLAERRAFTIAAICGSRAGPSCLFDLMEEDWTSADGAREEILPWLVQAFSSVPGTVHIGFAEFAEYQAAIGSPLGSTPHLPESAGSALATEEAMEELWKSFLGIFLGRCLLALGGAEAGITADGRPGFRMTDTGRSLLGLPRDGLPDHEPVDDEADAIVVQPNFEIVFLSPAPGVEAALGRFCERIGREVGVLFRITRQSVARAAAAGLSPGHVQETLARASRSPIPTNVAHEIPGWMAGGET